MVLQCIPVSEAKRQLASEKTRPACSYRDKQPKIILTLHPQINWDYSLSLAKIMVTLIH